MEGGYLGLLYVVYLQRSHRRRTPIVASSTYRRNAVVRRVLIGAAMGLTAVRLIYPPWGKKSGAFCSGDGLFSRD